MGHRRCRAMHDGHARQPPLAAPHMREPPPPPPGTAVVARRPFQGWATTAADGGCRFPPVPDAGVLATPFRDYRRRCGCADL